MWIYCLFLLVLISVATVHHSFRFVHCARQGVFQRISGLSRTISFAMAANSSVVVVGDGATGKTSFIARASSDEVLAPSVPVAPKLFSFLLIVVTQRWKRRVCLTCGKSSNPSLPLLLLLFLNHHRPYSQKVNGRKQAQIFVLHDTQGTPSSLFILPSILPLISKMTRP